jgi:hypothetical protein
LPPEILKYSLRTDKLTILKLRYIADNNFRTVNKELEKLVKTHIAEYERAHGEIKVLDEDKKI